ncbi:MAG: adenylate/guanylate cyclase domain-containing protein [Anaerolineales bacterium]|nr:MAG: adenylate/guanylate cyclase domain-containing protein [Anaerolineales bacterium]
MSGETKSSVPRSDLPEGTVTFIFTDIEGSTDLLKTLGDSYAAHLSKQREILRNCFVKGNGKEVDAQGDAFFYSFPRATEAVSAAVEAQRAIAAYPWPEGAETRVRMGLHTGEPSTWEEGYVGLDVHRAARIAHVGHGGQVLLSDTTASLIRNDQMEGVDLLELGNYRLKGLRHPERIFQLEIDDLPSEFPPLKSPDAGLPPHNLPPQPTPFVGRGPELEALDELIADPEVRLISIVAAGGMGKTRIALASASIS